MAELIGEKGLNLTRARLKRNMSTRDWKYPWFATSAWDICSQCDDFTGPIIETNEWTVGNGGGASAASFATSVGAIGGQVVGTTGTAGDNTASSTITGGRNFSGQTNAVITVRFYISAVVTNVKVEVGFRDAITTANNNHFHVNAKATPTFTGTDGAVWILDTTDNAYWEGVASKNGTAATTVEAAISPTASEFEYLQVALVGDVAYYSRFDQYGNLTYGPTAQAAAITAATLVAPYVSVEALNATSKSVYVDGIWVYGARLTTP